MTLLELLFSALAFSGLVWGIIIGAEHTWWWALLGAPLGLIAGVISYFAIMVPVMLIALGPREFFAHIFPRKPGQEHKDCKL
jgi:hypothetical protein